MDPIFTAVLKSDKDVERLVRAAPELSRIRATQDYLVEAVPHWLYIGDTSLHLAAAALRTGAAKILLEHGADANAENRRRATPLHYACDPRPTWKDTWNPIKQVELIGILVEHGADIDHSDKGGATPLHRAVRARSVAAVTRLLEAGARLDCRLGKNGSTPLHLATASTGAGGTRGLGDAQIEIIGVLLKHGADPDARDGAGRTPNDWARSERVSKALGGGRRKRPTRSS